MEQRRILAATPRGHGEQHPEPDASGTAISVLSSSASGEGALYQAFFYLNTFEGSHELKWVGYVQGLFIDRYGNIREDSNDDGALTYKEDLLVRTRYDADDEKVKADRNQDMNEDGLADTPAGTVALKEMKPIWEAGKRLALTDPNARTILTWVDVNNNERVDPGEQTPFTSSQATLLSPYLRGESSPSLYTASNIIGFIRGAHVPGLRDRRMTVEGSTVVWNLGDTIHSTPTVVGPPKERYDALYGDASYTAYYTKYRERRQMVYAGANDGMLHAFNAGFYHRPGGSLGEEKGVHRGRFTTNEADSFRGLPLGHEKWAFIPYQLLPQLKWLADPLYTHAYYMGLKPKVTDARISTGSGSS